MRDALAVLAGLRLDDGRRWGDAALSWQWDDARAILDGTPSYHFLTRPRGGSKTGDLGGVAVAVLLEQAPARARCFGLAADRDQGALLIDALGGYLQRTEEVSGALRVDAFKVTNPRSGATLEILSADESSSWGLRPYFVVVDELSVWRSTPAPRRLWTAVFSGLPKVPGSRLAVLTSPGDPSHWSAKILEQARSRPQRWRVSEVTGPVPWLSAGDLAEQRALLPAWEYERLVLGRWTAPPERLTNLAALRLCVVLDGPREHVPGRRYAVGVDVGLKHDRTAAAVCSLERVDGRARVALDRLQVWQGSPSHPVELDAVEAWLVEAWSRYGKPPVVCDPWQAAQLLQRLRARWVQAVEHPFTPQSVSRLALRLHQAVDDQALLLPDDEELLDELARVRLVERTPGVYRLDHEPGEHDDRAVALALAVQHLLASDTGGKAKLTVPQGRIGRPDPTGRRSGLGRYLARR
jgi:hypothetical protein